MTSENPITFTSPCYADQEFNIAAYAYDQDLNK